MHQNGKTHWHQQNYSGCKLVVFTSLPGVKVNGIFRNSFSPKNTNKPKKENKPNILLIVLSSFLGGQTTYHTVIKSVRHEIMKENNFDSQKGKTRSYGTGKVSSLHLSSLLLLFLNIQVKLGVSSPALTKPVLFSCNSNIVLNGFDVSLKSVRGTILTNPLPYFFCHITTPTQVI